MVQCHPVCHAATPIMSDYGKGAESQRLHNLDLICAHDTLRVSSVVCPTLGLGAVTVSAQIRRDYREVFSESGRDQVPHRASLRVAVEQQYRRSFASVNGVDARPPRLDPDALESLEHA